MRDTGTNGLECLDPPPIGNVKLEDAFKRIGNKMFVKGNINPVNTLFNGTEESITADIKHRLKIGMNNPGFILSTACSIAPKTPPGYIMLLRKLIDKYGYYT
jgi:uroporphyrinogen-III decarboxylase